MNGFLEMNGFTRSWESSGLPDLVGDVDFVPIFRRNHMARPGPWFMTSMIDKKNIHVKQEVSTSDLVGFRYMDPKQTQTNGTLDLPKGLLELIFTVFMLLTPRPQSLLTEESHVT